MNHSREKERSSMILYTDSLGMPIEPNQALDQNDKLYLEWMKDVDDEVQSIAGVSVYDLADFPSRDWYDSGVAPEEAAEDVLADNGWDG